MVYRSKTVRFLRKGTLSIIALSLLETAVASNPQPPTTASANSGAAVAPLILSGKQRARPEGTYSAGIADLISMLDANVDSGVILKYIENSAIAYNPDATELIAL